MRKFSALLLTTALLSFAAFQPALADDWHRHGDIHDFHEHGFDHWRGGSWFNGFHEGRHGWWWIVDGSWYFYPAPVYPYPDPYTPPTVVVETTPTPVPAGAQAYYYCANPAGYYPYVAQCAAWQRVISAPSAQPQVIVAPTPQPAPAPQAMVPAVNQYDLDLQQLNSFAAKLQNIDIHDTHVRPKLKDLEKQVEAFRLSLYKRNYNAMEMLRNAEDLKKRIADQRDWLAKHKGAMPPATVIMPAPATALPPGTSVTFPPPPQH